MNMYSDILVEQPWPVYNHRQTPTTLRELWEQIFSTVITQTFIGQKRSLVYCSSKLRPSPHMHTNDGTESTRLCTMARTGVFAYR